MNNQTTMTPEEEAVELAEMHEFYESQDRFLKAVRRRRHGVSLSEALHHPAVRQLDESTVKAHIAELVDDGLMTEELVAIETQAQTRWFATTS